MISQLLFIIQFQIMVVVGIEKILCPISDIWSSRIFSTVVDKMFYLFYVTYLSTHTRCVVRRFEWIHLISKEK